MTGRSNWRVTMMNHLLSGIQITSLFWSHNLTMQMALSDFLQRGVIWKRLSRNLVVLWGEKPAITCLLCHHVLVRVISCYCECVSLTCSRSWTSTCILSWGHHHWGTFPRSQKNQQNHGSRTYLLQRVSMYHRSALFPSHIKRNETDLETLSVLNFHSYDFSGFLRTQVMIYAIREANRILPNFTIGYDIYDTCGDVSLAIRATLELLRNQSDLQDCLLPTSVHSALPDPETKVVIGEQSSEVSIVVARILALASVTQVCSSCLLLRNIFKDYLNQ